MTSRVNETQVCVDFEPEQQLSAGDKKQGHDQMEKGGEAGDRRKVFSAAFVSPRVSFALLNHFASRSALFFNRFYCGAHAIFIS